MLIEVVGELALGIILGIHPAVQIGDTQRISVENDSENATDSDCFLVSFGRTGNTLDFAGAGEIVVSTGSLPVRDALASLHLGIDFVVGIGLEIHVRRSDELGEINGVLKFMRCKSLHTSGIEKRGHSCHSVTVEANLEGRISDELGCSDGLVCR